MRSKLLAAGCIAIGLQAVTGSALACAVIGLPTPTIGNTVTFGDAVDYALPILGLDYASSPGQISDCIVIGTGASGTGVTTNIPGADNAYPTPSGSGGPRYCSTRDPLPQAEPTAPFAGQTDHTWRSRRAALDTVRRPGADPGEIVQHNPDKCCPARAH